MSDIVKKEEGFLFDASQYAGETGFEEVSNETFKTPFLKILQKLSPEIDKNDSKFVADAEEGQFYNTATKETYDEIEVVILKMSHELVAWKPNRGGFVGSYKKREEKSIVARQDGVRKYDHDGNDVLDTINFFCMNINNPADVFIISLSVTSFKYGQNWATQVRLLKSNGKPVGVSWAGVWKIKTVEERNDKGRWFTIGNSPTFERFVNKEEVDQFVIPAIELVKASDVDYNTMEQSSGSGDNAGPVEGDDGEEDAF